MPTLNWIGKDKVVSLHNDVPFHVLEHGYGFTADGGKTEVETGSGNKIIHGDNLTALKSLLPEYEGRVDCIYIDPPYNTGNENWVYNDNVNDPRIKRWLGEVVGKEGEDLSRHDKWCCMIYPRLRLLKELLSEHGVIFISIDDIELFNLKGICDEIFGLNCFIAKITWQDNYSIRNDSKGIPYETDNILVYSKMTGWNPRRLARTAEMNARYVNYDNDDTDYKVTPIHAPGAASHKSMVYAIQQPITGELMYPPIGRHWKDGQEKLLNILKEWAPYELRVIDDREKRAEICGSDVPENIPAIMLSIPFQQASAIANKRYHQYPWPTYFFLSQGRGSIQSKTYLNASKGKVVSTLWKYNDVGTNVEATTELKTLLCNGPQFDTPKPTRLLQRILEIATNKDSIILDSFAGSGTTAHAVLDLNKKDGGNRKFILIEMMDYADTITAERVKRVMTGYPYKGKKEEEIYSKRLTPKNIAHGEKLLAEAQAKADDEAKNYTKVSKPKIQDNCLKVIGTIVTDEKMPGLGGAFDYYELGPSLFDKDGFLNEDVGEDAIREYVYYSETRQHLTRQRQESSKYLLDTFGGTAYYFYYEPHCMTSLDFKSPLHIAEKADQYIIYADVCYLPDDYMRKHHIIFKKIPRDIRQF